MAVTAAVAEKDTAKFCTNEPGCRSAVSVVREAFFTRWYKMVFYSKGFLSNNCERSDPHFPAKQAFHGCAQGHIQAQRVIGYAGRHTQYGH